MVFIKCPFSKGPGLGYGSYQSTHLDPQRTYCTCLCPILWELSPTELHDLQICVYLVSFKEHFDLPFAINREFQSHIRFEDLDLGDAEIQIQALFECCNSRFKKYDMECFLKHDTLFALLASLKAQREQ